MIAESKSFRTSSGFGKSGGLFPYLVGNILTALNCQFFQPADKRGVIRLFLTDPSNQPALSIAIAKFTVIRKEDGHIRRINEHAIIIPGRES